MTEPEILDRLEILRQKKVKLYFDYELLKKSRQIEDKEKLEALKNEIDEVNTEFSKLMFKKAELNLNKEGKLL